MANDFDLDFGDFSPDYDLNYDFSSDQSGTKKTNKKKGDVVREFASGLWEGAKSGLGSYGMPTRLIKSILPRSYSPALDSLDRTLRFKDDLYDKVREETKDTVYEFKELTREAMGSYGNKVPAKLAKRLEDWANSSSSKESWRDYVTDDGEKLDTDANTDDLLEAMTHGTAANAELSQAQHNELMGALAAGAVANQKGAAQQTVLLDQLLTMNRRLLGHTETITSTYQRRSLELQFRHYKLDISVAKMQERYYKRSLEAFSNMINNSAMTDIEKAARSPGHQRLVNKSYGTGPIRSTMSRYGNHLYDSMYNIVGDAAANKNLKWSSSAGAVAAAMRAGQQAKMSGMMGGARGKGMMAGNMIASAAPFLLQQLARNRMEKNGRANGMGHNLSYYAESAPGLINGWLRNRQNLDEHYDEFDPKNKWYTRLQKGVLNPMVNNTLFNIPVTQGNKTRVTTPNVKDLMQPAQYDMMSRRSLVEVIPGLLTQQLSVQQKLLAEWSGKEAPPEEAFNHRQGAFTTKARVKADVRASIFNRSEFQSAAGSFNSMVEAIDPDEELSANARVALAMRFARDADAGDGFNINNYLSNTGWINTTPETITEISDFLHERFQTKEATGKAAKFGKYQIGEGADVAELRKRVANNMQSQQQYMPNVEGAVNSLANGGQRAILKEMGIIQRVNGQEVFNHDMYWQMMQKFISNPNFRPDLEDDGKPANIGDRIDTGAVTDLVDKAKDRLKGAADDLGVTDLANNAKDRIKSAADDMGITDLANNAKDRVKSAATTAGTSDVLTNAKDKVSDILGRGKDAASDTTQRLKASMTRSALNQLYDNAIGRYDDLVTQLQALAASGNDVDIRLGIAEVKERGFKAIRHIQQQLHELDAEALGEEAYATAQAQGEQIIQSLRNQLDKLDISSLRSGVDTNIVEPVAGLVDSVQMGARARGAVPKQEAPSQDNEPSPAVALASEQNDLLRELIGVTASARDQITATKDATIASITGDPDAINNGVEERKGFLKSLSGRMKSREAGKIARAVGLGKMYSSGVFTMTKWATLGPAIVGWKGAKMLYKFFRKKKDKDLGDTDGDGIRENSWMDQLRKRKNKPAKEEKTDKDGAPKDKPASIFGLLTGIWSGVTGLFGGIKELGILGGLAKFLGMGWLGTLVKGVGGAIAGLGKLIMGKKAVDSVTDSLGDLADDAGDVDQRGQGARRRPGARDRLDRMRNRNRPRGGILKRSARWVGKNVIGKGARLVAGEPGRMAGRASWLLKGGAKTLAKRIPVVGAAAMGAFEMYDSYKNDDGLGMADSAGGTAGAMAGAMAGAAVGSVVPIVGTFIGGVVGGAIGGLMGSKVGSSIYKWIKSPGLLQQMRLYQYGLDSINSDFTGKIFALEAGLEKYVKITDGGKAMIARDAPLADLAKPFIEDPNNPDEVQAFAGWFSQRFKPVFLTHYAVAKQLFPGVAFSEVDASKDNAAKYEMGKRCQEFAPSIDHPYRWSGMLFNTQPALDYSRTVSEVQEVVDKLKAQVKKQDANTKSSSVITTGNDATTRTQAMDKGIVDAIKPTNGGKLKGVDLEGTTSKVGPFGQEIITVSVQDVLGSVLPQKGQPLDDLMAARMKIYGLPNLDINKVSVLLQLELVMQNRVTYNGKGVSFSGKTKEVFDVMASAFGHGFLSAFSFKSWSTWFSRRFLPAYLAFASVIYNQASETKPTLVANKMPPETKLAAITSMMSQTYNDGRTEAGIWTVSASPWSDLDTSNTDATVVDVHINNLKQLARVAQYEAKPVKGGIKQSEDGTTDKEWRKDTSTGMQTSNAVKGTDGLVRSDSNQETIYDPKTGQTTQGYGSGPMGSGTGPAGSEAGGGLDTTGKVEPLKMGPGTEEGVRAMIRQAVKNGITDKKELAIMLANTHHETGGFRQVEENLGYKPQTLMKLWPKRFPTMEKASAVAGGGAAVIANTIYGGRMGNTEPGDGYKYRGRGFIQLTGKENYTRASKALGVDLVDDPDAIAEDPEMAASSALYFWKANKKIGEQARAGNVAGVRKIVNGGTIGLEDTQKLTQQYMQTLGNGQYDDIISGKDKGDTGSTSDGGSSMSDIMGQSAQEQAEQSGEGTPAAVTGTTAAERSAPGAAAAATAAAAPPPGSVTNAAPADGSTPPPPPMESTTGPSAAAETNAQSVTPNAPNSAASGEDAALNKTEMQSQQPSNNQPISPIPVAMEMDDTHVKATAANTASTNEKLDKMIEALNQIAGTNKAMAEKEDAPAASPATPTSPNQAGNNQVLNAARSAPQGAGNSNISLKRNYN